MTNPQPESTVTMKQEKQETPFKIIPVEVREHLHELTGNELKVWMCLFLHTDKTGTAFPSNQTIMDGTGVSDRTLVRVKQGLRKKGWLKAGVQRFRKDGTCSSLRETITHPGKVDTYTPESLTPTPLSDLQGSPLSNLQGHEVDTLEVDTGKSDTSKPEEQGSKEGREPPPFASLTTASTNAPENQQPEPTGSLANQDQKQNQLPDYPSWSDEPPTQEEQNLLEALMPMGKPNQITEAQAWVRATARRLSQTRVNLPAMLRYNRSHKRGGLVIRTAKQLYSAFTGDRLINEYLTHPSPSCPTCKASGSMYESKQHPYVPPKPRFEHRLATKEELVKFAALRGDGFERGMVKRVLKPKYGNEAVNAAYLFCIGACTEPVTFDEFRLVVQDAYEELSGGNQVVVDANGDLAAQAVSLE